MGKQAPQAPAAPDPYKTASAQTGTNIQTAIANATIGNANQVGPTGSTTYDITGSQSITGADGQVYNVPRYTQTTKLSPEQQKLYDQQTQLGSGLNQLALNQTSKLTDLLGKPVDASGLPAVDDLTSMQGRQRVEDALFQRLNPQLERDRASLENNLTNQGFQRGTQAFTDAMDQYNRQSNDARLAVTSQGLQEQQGLFGMQQAGRNRALQEMLALRNQPINEITALMSGGQVNLPQPQQYNAPQVANTGLGDYVYNSAALNQQKYKNDMDAYSKQMGGLYGLAGTGLQAAMFMSDRRLKTDIRELGVRLMNGLKLYTYRYLWGGKVMAGVMADEVAAVNPAAVANVGGFLAVNYRAL